MYLESKETFTSRTLIKIKPDSYKIKKKFKHDPIYEWDELDSSMQSQSIISRNSYQNQVHLSKYFKEISKIE